MPHSPTSSHGTGEPGSSFGAAVVPSVLVIALWKERGLGQLPVLSLEETRLAAHAGVVALSVDLDKYIELDWDHFRTQMDQLREYFWSARLAQWAPFAGLLAVIRVRRGAIAALLGGWLGAFLLVKGFSTRATIDSHSFWRLLLPAWPAYLLLFASIPLLVPTFARRLGDRLRTPPSLPVAWRWIAVAAVLTVVVPATAIAASSPTKGPELAVFQDDAGNFILTPVDEDVEVDGRARPTTVARCSWTSGGPVARRRLLPRLPHRRALDDVECENTDGATSEYCFLSSGARSRPRARRRSSTPRLRQAGATYRIGVATNWLDDPAAGRRVRVQSAGSRERLTRSSSRAIRWARSTFSSVSARSRSSSAGARAG